MNPTELINPRCKLTGTVPVIRSTRHLFLDLPKLSDRLQHYIDSTSQLGGWTSNCMQVRCCTATALYSWIGWLLWGSGDPCICGIQSEPYCFRQVYITA